MSDEVMENRFAGHLKPAWHHKGTVFTDRKRAPEAAELVRLDEVLIDKVPLMLDLGGVQVESGHYGLVRRPTPADDQYRMLGVCGKDYTFLQHSELVAKLDGLSQKWPVETIGVLGQGETVFLTLDAGEGSVKGDPVQMFFLVTDTKDGGRGISLHFTPVRVVCRNTLVIGTMAAVASANLRHTANVEQSLDWHIGLVEAMQSQAEKVMAAFNALAEAKLTEAEVKRVLLAAYPMPRKPRKVEVGEQLTPEETSRLALAGLHQAMLEAERSFETARLRLEERRESVFARYAGNSETSVKGELAGTGWALYNAVVEEEDYRKAASANEDVHVATLFGGRAQTKTRAFAELLKVTGK